MARKSKSILASFDKDRRIPTLIMVPVLMIWLSILYSADSYLSPYLFFALLCLVSCAGTPKQNMPLPKREKIYRILFSALFSLAIVLANYKLISPLKDHLLSAAYLLAVGFIVGWYILALTLRAEPWKTHRSPKERDNTHRWFLFPFFTILLIYLLTLFYWLKPGILTYDSMVQIKQIFNGSYSNHHPFWHTMIIKLFMDLGMFLFDDINSAVAVYSVFQILCMSAVFSFICMTLYQAGTPKTWVLISAGCFAFLPYHIFYSMTMWKDILYAGSAALFCCALFRLFKQIGRKRLNYILLGLGSLGSCLLRSNGMAAFVFTFIILVLFLRKQEKKILLIMLSAVIAAFILKSPVLKALHVRPIGTMEYLGIPVQLTARLIVDDVDLEESELSLIEQIMPADEIRKNYSDYIYDPIKNNIKGENQSYLKEHKLDYFALWLRLGLKHPVTYLHAWIDMTRGYWNGGYDYWILGYGIHENDYGIRMSPNDNAFARLMIGWVNDFLKYPAFELFRSIGLHVWILLLCCTNNMIKKRREWMIYILPLANILSLFISAQVYCEFRVVYAIFTTFPLLVLLTFTPETADQ